MSAHLNKDGGQRAYERQQGALRASLPQGRFFTSWTTREAPGKVLRTPQGCSAGELTLGKHSLPQGRFWNTSRVLHWRAHPGKAQPTSGEVLGTPRECSTGELTLGKCSLPQGRFGEHLESAPLESSPLGRAAYLRGGSGNTSRLLHWRAHPERRPTPRLSLQQCPLTVQSRLHPQRKNLKGILPKWSPSLSGISEWDNWLIEWREESRRKQINFRFYGHQISREKIRTEFYNDPNLSFFSKVRRRNKITSMFRSLWSKGSKFCCALFNQLIPLLAL